MALLAEALRTQSEGVLIARGKIDEGGLEILFVNDSFCAITGRPAQKLIGKPHRILHADPADVARARLWLGEAHPGQPLVGEGPLVREDGSTISAAWSFNPLFNRRGRLTHVVAIYRDQTEKRRLQEALVHSQRLDAVGRLAGVDVGGRSAGGTEGRGEFAGDVPGFTHARCQDFAGTVAEGEDGAFKLRSYLNGRDRCSFGGEDVGDTFPDVHCAWFRRAVAKASGRAWARWVPVFMQTMTTLPVAHS